MDYMGYKIEKEFDHFTVTDPNGRVWRVDTLKEAEEDILEDIESKNC